MKQDGALENIIGHSVCLHYRSNKMLPRLLSLNYQNNVHINPATNDKTEVFLNICSEQLLSLEYLVEMPFDVQFTNPLESYL